MSKTLKYFTYLFIAVVSGILSFTLFPFTAHAQSFTSAGDVVLTVIGADAATLNDGTGSQSFIVSSDELIIGNDVSSVIINGNGIITDSTISITLSGASINKSSNAADCAFALQNSARVNLVLRGNNTLQSGQDRAGLEIPAGCSLTIGVPTGEADTSGILSSESNGYGAGIGSAKGSNAGSITITSGTINALSRRIGEANGAGIGSGSDGNASIITISGGTIDAYSSYSGGSGNGAGIGGGAVLNTGSYTGSGGVITISEPASITAASSKAHMGNGAGIGSGRVNETGTTIIIDGGTVNAYSSQFSSPAIGNGAGIGGGFRGVSGTVKINGGTITAISSLSGPGIGAGIGGGRDSDGGSIIITGGTVVAASCINGSGSGAGIGGGGPYYGIGGAAGTIQISGGTIIAGSSQKMNLGSGSAIGSGVDADNTSSSVSISGGSITVSKPGDLGSGAAETINPAPTNLGVPVYAAVVQLGALQNGITITGGSLGGVPMGASGYGIKDMQTNASGQVCLWVPKSTDLDINLTANDIVFVGAISPSETPASPVIIKAIGAAVAPEVLGEPSPTRIMIKEITPSTGQNVEYGISLDGMNPPSSWQAGTTFSGLEPEKQYYIWSKALESGNYYAGTPTPSSAILTPAYLVHDSYWLQGNNEYTLKSGIEISLSCDFPFDSAAQVFVNKQKLNEDQVALSSGSTVATLKTAYLNTLSAGTYEIELLFSDGSSSVNTFYVKNAPASAPEDSKKLAGTGDNTPMVIFIAILAIAAGLLFLTKNYRKMPRGI